MGVDDEEVELQGADDATALAVSRRCTCFTALVILDSQLHNSTLQALLQTAKHRLVALDLSGSGLLRCRPQVGRRLERQ